MSDQFEKGDRVIWYGRPYVVLGTVEKSGTNVERVVIEGVDTRSISIAKPDALRRVQMCQYDNNNRDCEQTNPAEWVMHRKGTFPCCGQPAEQERFYCNECWLRLVIPEVDTFLHLNGGCGGTISQRRWWGIVDRVERVS